jgi:two-component system chemotaxis response regulator CheB
MDVYHLAEELAGKVKAAARCRVERDGAPVRPEPAPVRAGGERPQPRATAAGAGIVVIGASTGGPPAIARLLGWLPRDFAAPVLIVQHMPSGYTAAFAERLGRAGRLPVRHAEDGDPVLPGQALVAPGGMNLGLRLAGGAVVAHVMDGPAHSMLRPSLDICLEAAVGTFGGATCAVVLTGMGNDGVLGAAAVRAAGGRVFAQSAESCVVFGMPKAVIHAGLATEVASLEEIGEMLAGWRRRT